MLGPEVKTYQRNTIVFVVAVLFLLTFLAFGAALWREGGDSRQGAYVCFAIAALGGLWVAWINSCRLTIHSDGVSTVTMFGAKEMRFDELDRITYMAVKQSVNFIPIGTYYTLKLVNTNRQKIKFGNRFAKMQALSDDLVRLSTSVLLPKVAQRFDAGETLDFGAIKVSRADGISIKKTFKWKNIPWERLASHQIDKGTFYIFEVGQKFDTGTSLGAVDNAFVLATLLDVLRQPASSAAGAQ